VDGYAVSVWRGPSAEPVLSSAAAGGAESDSAD